VSDDGLDGTLGEGAPSGFELEFEPEWVDRGPADAQLAFGFARQNTSCEQATLG
jgi:hypothetical protein